MPHYCTNCSINWARLESHDCEGDESYDVCPICKTDTWLTDGKNEPAFIRSPLDRVIINPVTGEEYRRFQDHPVTVAEIIQTNYDAFYDRKQEREDEALELYQQALAAGMLEEEAKAIYRAKMAKG